jgi:hypothetical protein
MLETVFGPTLTLTGCSHSTRWVGEQRQGTSAIPSFADWMRAIRPLP